MDNLADDIHLGASSLPSPPTVDTSAHNAPLNKGPSPVPPPTPPTAPLQPTCAVQQPARYGNLKTYAAVTKRAHNPDNPTYAQAMSSPERDQWRAAMQVEFDSLVSHSVGRLVPRPKSANVLGGMWRFKRKRDTSGNVTKYKARWVILGNHQIHGIDYFETYASVGVKESLHTLYALPASEDLELQSFDIITAFLTGSMDVPVHTVQVQGFEDQSRDILLLN